MYKYYWDSGVVAFRHSPPCCLDQGNVPPPRNPEEYNTWGETWNTKIWDLNETPLIEGWHGGTVGLYPIQSIIWIHWLTHVKCKIQGGGSVTEYITAPTLPLHPAPSPSTPWLTANTNSRTLYQIPSRYQADIYYFWSKYHTYFIVGNNLVSGQLENFFHWNPSGTFRNIPWYH